MYNPILNWLKIFLEIFLKAVFEKCKNFSGKFFEMTFRERLFEIPEIFEKIV